MKQLLVFGEKTFRISVPDDAKITFGPFSPPTKHGYESNAGGAKGTLRIYQDTKDNIVACFAGVTGFRDMSLGYAEEVAKEEGATIWKSDQDGYHREEKTSMRKEWVEKTLDGPPQLAAPKKKKRA